MARYKDIEPIIDFITNGLNNPDKTKAFGHDAIEILAEIEYAPTADVVEVRHGHWIHKVKRYPYQPDDCEAVCSVCGTDYALDPEYNIKWFAKDNKFCSNCGARMDGDTE